MRLSKAQRAELARHASGLRESRTLVAARFREVPARLADAVAPVNSAIAVHNERLAAAMAFVEAVAVNLRDDYDGKGERWQESEAGQAASAMADAWEDVALEAVGPVLVLAPDAPDLGGSGYALELPEEPDL